MKKETLKTEKIDKSLLITFTRPDEMNTFSGKMMVEIMETLDEAESDDSVRSVIVQEQIFLKEKKRSIGQKEIKRLME
jgi:enoyl-CoA hydratase/carnithine racemase